MTKETEEEFRSYVVSDNSHFELVELNNDEMFYKLIKLFKEINAKCHTLIDDYENELVEVNKLEKILEVVEKFNGLKHEPEVSEFLEKFKALIRKAVGMDMPLVFVL